MKKVIGLLIAMLMASACKKEDSCENLPLRDYAEAFLFITLVDVDGINLIENDTYLETEIKVSIDGIEYPEEVVLEDTNQSGETRKVIGLRPVRKKGDQIALLTLNETITDTILINLTEFEQKDACFNYVSYKFNSVLYNDQPQTLNSEFVARITVVKE